MGWIDTLINPRWLPVVGTMTLLGLAAGCNGQAQPVPATTVAAPMSESKPAPRIVHPDRKTIRHAIEQPGFNIEPFQETPLYPKIAGYIHNWEAKIDIGATVHKGQVLAELYVPELKVAVEQKEAAVRAAQAQIRVKKAAGLTAQAQVERLQRQYDRLARAGQQGVLDRDQVDEIGLGLRAAQAGVEQANADVAAAQAQEQVAKADLAYAQTMLGYATIRAPFAGIITQRHINTDSFVQPAGTGRKDLPLYVVEQIDPVRVFVNVPATDAPWVRDGDPVNLRLQGAGGRLIQGKVTRNAGALDPQTRTLRVEVDVPNPPNSKGRLLPGTYVQATITVEHANAWTLPASAVVTLGDQAYCYRAVDGKAVRTPLQLGLRGDGLIEVLSMQAPPARRGEEGRWQLVTGTEEVVATDLGSLTNGQALAGGAASKTR